MTDADQDDETSLARLQRVDNLMRQACRVTWTSHEAYDDFMVETLRILNLDELQRVFQATRAGYQFKNCRTETEKCQWIGTFLSFQKVLAEKGGDFGEELDRPLPTPAQDLKPKIVWKAKP